MIYPHASFLRRVLPPFLQYFSKAGFGGSSLDLHTPQILFGLGVCSCYISTKFIPSCHGDLNNITCFDTPLSRCFYKHISPSLPAVFARLAFDRPAMAAGVVSLGVVSR